MSTRRRKLVATMHFEPGGAATIQEIFYSVGTRIQGTVSTETPCTIRITAIVTTDPTPAEIERHVSPFHLGPEQYQNDPILESQGITGQPIEKCPKCKTKMRHWVSHIRKCPRCRRVAWYNDANSLKDQTTKAASDPPTEGQRVGLLHNMNPTKLIRFQPGEPVLHGFTPDVQIKKNYTDEHKTIERIEVNDTLFTYITTDGTRFNREALLLHWTVVDKQEAK